MTEFRFTRANRHLREIGDDRAIADNGIPCTQSYVLYLLNSYEELVKELKDELFSVTSALIYETSTNPRKEIEEAKKEIYGDE